VTSERATTPEPSEIAGRFQIVSKLGAGAFGTVYKAKDRVLGRMVAIKTIRLDGLAAQGASLDELLDRFKREAEVSAQLKHPNIVTIYDIGQSEGLSYLAMEFIDGVGLDKVISTSGRLPLERAVAIGAQVADALDYAHKRNVVHRDIKPANVMIETGDRVKVTDFGIAKVIDSGEHLTVTGSLLGTPSYMSPEQARGGAIDGRSDLFSAGCIVYEMLTGKKAFRGESITALIFKIITEEPQPIRELDPTIPEPIVRIIKKALSKAPETRYQSGHELAADLMAFSAPAATPTLRQVEAPTALIPPAALSETAVKPPGPPPATTIAHPTQATARRAPLPPPAPRPPARRSNMGLFLALGALLLAFLAVAAGAGWYFFLRKPGGQTVVDGSAATQPATTPDSLTPTTQTPDEPPPQLGRGESTPAPQTLPTTTAPQPHLTPSGRPAPPPTTAPSPESREATSGGGRASEGGDFSFLENLPSNEDDGTEAGRRLAEGFRSQRGTGGGGTFGSGRRFRARPRVPQHSMAEKPAVGMLFYLMSAEEALKRRTGRYGSFSDLAAQQALFLDVPHKASSFQRKGYHFELTLQDDGFQINATPTTPGRRQFVVDDGGIVRAGSD
jgi:serine/threonine protein kinase